MNTDTELSVWDYLNDVYFKKQSKPNIEKVNEVSNRKHLVEKHVKKNKEHINIPNATIKYYNYRYEQDPSYIQNTEQSSEALKTNENNRKTTNGRHQEYSKGYEEIIIKDIE